MNDLDKLKGTLDDMAKSTLSTLLGAALRQPGFLAVAAEWDRVRTQAKAAGVLDEFDLAFHYEVERAREQPGRALEPKEVLQIVVKVAGP